MHKTAWEFRKMSSFPLSFYGVINEMSQSLQLFFQPFPPQRRELSSRNIFIWLSRLIMMDGWTSHLPLLKMNQSAIGQSVGGTEHKVCWCQLAHQDMIELVETWIDSACTRSRWHGVISFCFISPYYFVWADRSPAGPLTPWVSSQQTIILSEAPHISKDWKIT